MFFRWCRAGLLLMKYGLNKEVVMNEVNYKFFIPHHFCHWESKSGGGCKMFLNSITR